MQLDTTVTRYSYSFFSSCKLLAIMETWCTFLVIVFQSYPSLCYSVWKEITPISDLSPICGLSLCLQFFLFLLPCETYHGRKFLLFCSGLRCCPLMLSLHLRMLDWRTARYCLHVGLIYNILSYSIWYILQYIPSCYQNLRSCICYSVYYVSKVSDLVPLFQLLVLG